MTAVLVREGGLGAPPKSGMSFSPDPVRITVYGDRVLAFLRGIRNPTLRTRSRSIRTVLESQ